MTYKLVIASEKVWLKDMRKLTHKQTNILFREVRNLASEPWPDNVQVKKLQHYDLADFRLRIGDYRVLFDKNTIKKEIVLYRILHRSKLY